MRARSVGASRRILPLALGGLFGAGPALAAPPVPAEPAVDGNGATAVAVTGSGVVVLAQITGVVATEDGNPLPGALVSVFATDGDDGARFAVTDEEGRFEVGEASPGLYSLRAYLAGFLPSPRAQVLVRSGASLADTLLIQLAAIGSQEGAGTLSELRWLLQRGRRNVLKERRAGVDIENEWQRIWEGNWKNGPRLPALQSLEGEFGFFATSGSSLGLPESRAVDSGIAYTRFELPSTARGSWQAEARLMESAFASWAANLSYTMEEFDGHQFAAGIGYQRHVYGDAPDYRPPAAPILNTALLQESQAEWDGAAFVADDFTLGRASLSTGLTYRRFSYLTGHRGLAPRAVLEFDVSDDWTLMGGMAVRLDGPIGEDAALLSRVAHGDLLALDPSWFGSEAAQRNTRYQTGIRYEASPNHLLAARLFRELTTDQFVRAFESSPISGGRFDVSNAGDYTSTGFAFDWIRELGPVTRRLDLGGRVSWLVAVVRSPGAASTEAAGFGTEPAAPAAERLGFVGPHDSGLSGSARLLLPVGASAVLHDLSGEVVARLRPSGTRINAAYRVIRHPGLAPTHPAIEAANDLTARFDVELVQLIPFADWSGTEWELSLAVRDLFFREMIGRSLLDEIAVAHAPRRVVGGVAVRF